MLGILTLIGAGLATLCSTARDMYKDNLITKKELAEIEAKEKAFSKLIDHKSKIVDRAFDLEMEVLSCRGYIIDKIVYLTERFEKLNDEIKINAYFNLISSLIQQLNNLITQNPKYFTKEFIESNSVKMIDFHNNTQIGESTTNYEIPVINLKSIPTSSLKSIGSKPNKLIK